MKHICSILRNGFILILHSHSVSLRLAWSGLCARQSIHCGSKAVLPLWKNWLATGSKRNPMWENLSISSAVISVPICALNYSILSIISNGTSQAAQSSLALCYPSTKINGWHGKYTSWKHTSPTDKISIYLFRLEVLPCVCTKH